MFAFSFGSFDENLRGSMPPNKPIFTRPEEQDTWSRSQFTIQFEENGKRAAKERRLGIRNRRWKTKRAYNRKIQKNEQNNKIV